jgi:hypothetical protein
MFGWKAKYKQLASEYTVLIEAHDDRLKVIENQEQTINEMADTIRNMDQLIFQMSRKTDWSSIRPLFNQLQVGQERRMKAESNRISNIMRRELISVYTKKV